MCPRTSRASNNAREHGARDVYICVVTPAKLTQCDNRNSGLRHAQEETGSLLPLHVVHVQDVVGTMRPVVVGEFVLDVVHEGLERLVLVRSKASQFVWLHIDPVRNECVWHLQGARNTWRTLT